jgi:O-antigen/teichoic acid export membrane protein
MKHVARPGPLGAAVASNLTARVAALAALTAASVLVARTEGAAGVGLLVMLRLVPWLVGLLASCGLYGAAPYFLTERDRQRQQGVQPVRDGQVTATLAAIAVGAGTAGTLLWLLATPELGSHVFPTLSPGLVALAGVCVLTQVLETTAKACSQGTGDLRGANRVIVLEEVLFLPGYVALIATGFGGPAAMVVALLLGDLVDATQAWVRLGRRGFFRPRAAPTWRHARRIASYGVRAQAGSIALLLNARLDFALVTALAGPATLGVYAVASRYAELLRLPALALNYVLYPAYARQGAGSAADARAVLRRSAWLPAVAAVPMAAAAPLVLPAVYGNAFADAVVPAWILLAGLAGSGVTGVILAWLSGTGRPGLGSTAIAAGLVVTLTLDVALIPGWAEVGAAVASTVAYLATTAVLALMFRALTHSPRPELVQLPDAPFAVAPDGARRTEVPR